MGRMRAQAFVLLVLTVAPARAQTPTGTIVGVVKDASGAAIAGVQVSITNSQIHQVRIITASTEGQYVAELLQPGVYLVTVEANGFKRLRATVVRWHHGTFSTGHTPGPSPTVIAR